MTDSRSPKNSTSRRAFLGRAAAASGGLALLSESGLVPDRGVAAALQESDYPPGKDPADFIRHSSVTFETRRGAFGTGVVTPTDLVFVRNNRTPPDASVLDDIGSWTVDIEGVRNTRTMSVREMQGLGVETIATVLQCSGNGRQFFEHRVGGSPWGVGAAACVIWSGVPVRAVVEALGGASAGAEFVTATGGEPVSSDEDPRTVLVERSIPIAKGMDDAILAWEMNGEPIPLVHGGPLRLIVPGYFGINQVKYVRRLALTAQESDANIMRTGYRVRPIGESGDPSQPSMWEMSVKSWIHRPSGDEPVDAGRVAFHGVAFGGTRAVRSVEVSVDGGRSWMDAPLIGPDLGPYAWRQFAFTANLSAGRHTVMSRATDVTGNTQPERRIENHRGYGNTSWRDHAVTVVAE